jgi:glutamate N-acetyltransferase / amino-acid N-acetyltransferase
MPVQLPIPVESDLLPIAGVRIGVAEAGIRKANRKDLTVFLLDEGCAVGAVFTRNRYAAAPVQVCREHLASGQGIRAMVINTGNANAGTGESGLANARQTCSALARSLQLHHEQVLPFSTGVIGQRLPVARMVAAIPRAAAQLDPDGWMTAMRAIMTTDTVPKGASRSVRTSQGVVTLTGIAKGVGMIHPDMATMLAFIGTDARLSADATQSLLREVAGRTFNCVTVDGDTSTNDACMLFATARVGHEDVGPGHADYPLLAAALEDLCRELAHAIVRDGEGATKFITITVEQARSADEARQVALSVAHSPLVKTAMFASDANWGRIAMAIGKAGVEGLDASRVRIGLDDVLLIHNGEPHPGYREDRGAAIVAQPEFTIRIGLGRGEAAATVWTCDFSYDYVKINAEYRT